jgi:hypothetical protein
VHKLATTPEGEALILNVARESDVLGAPMVCEPVRQSDLFFMRDETWMQGLRNGKLPWDLLSLGVRYLASRRAGSGMLNGMILELSSNGQKVRRLFPPGCFDLTLQRALAGLLQSGELQLHDDIHYWLSCEPTPAVVEAAADSDDRRATDATRLEIRVCSSTWQPESARLAEYLDASRPLRTGAAAPQPGDENDRRPHLSVFIHPDAWEQGRRFACRHENLESAAVFTGRLMQDPSSFEAFVIIDTCIEAAHADEQQYSVMLTDETWAEVRRVLDCRRRRLGRPHEIIVGSVHGHPFLPAADEQGQRPCPSCDKRPTCTKTTAVASTDDVEWHRSVFAGQPWAILAVWGWNAREEEVSQVYGLAGGTLVPRTIRILNREPH